MTNLCLFIILMFFRMFTLFFQYFYILQYFIMFNDDEDEYEGFYEKGHWKWDNVENELKFISDIIEEDPSLPVLKKLHQNFEFKDDIDLLHQQKFEKKYQRKTKEGAVVILQDVKDIVFYTAPVSILSPAVINMLHLPTTERFLRALILYFQYYLQISETMRQRTEELGKKIRCKNSDIAEEKYKDDLEELRLLVAKEYTSIILGTGKYSKFHHMKTFKNQSDKDARFYKTVLRLALQIVWISLGRYCYQKIELEICRIFESDIYNNAEHRIKFNLEPKINLREKSVKFGHCVKPGRKVNIQSPLINEIFCHKKIYYQYLGLGHIKYHRLSDRMKFLENLLIQPEHRFRDFGINLGILGLPRAQFDIMLREIKSNCSVSSFNFGLKSRSRISRMSRSRLYDQHAAWATYPRIYLPDHGSFEEHFPDHFPRETIRLRRCDQTQRRKWLTYIKLKRKRRVFK